MPVARTYEKYPIEGEVYKKNGKPYVKVRAKNGLKEVRWYTEAERARMDKTAGINTPNDLMDFNARHAFGFDEKGFITLYKGKNVEEWAEKDRTNIWRNLTFGYYTPSKFELPKLVEGVEPITLKWEEVMDYDNRMKPHEEVSKYVNSLLVLDNASSSDFQGTENEWLQKEVKVREKKTRESNFGTKHTYTLVDAEGNVYIWETGAKDYTCDTTVSLKMKVKAHKETKGEKCTIVWYCKEV